MVLITWSARAGAAADEPTHTVVRDDDGAVEPADVMHDSVMLWYALHALCSAAVEQGLVLAVVAQDENVVWPHAEQTS